MIGISVQIVGIGVQIVGISVHLYWNTQRYRLRLLGHEMSADVIRRELNALQVSILVESPSQDQYGMPSQASSDAKRIYRSVGLSWNEQPFAVSATERKRKPAAQR